MTFLLRIKNTNLIKIQCWAIFSLMVHKQYFKQYLLLIISNIDNIDKLLKKFVTDDRHRFSVDSIRASVCLQAWEKCGLFNKSSC